MAAAKALADKQVEIAEEAKKKLEEAVAARASAQAQAEEAAKEASSAMQKAESAGTLFSLPALFLKTAIGRVGVRGQGSRVIRDKLTERGPQVRSSRLLARKQLSCRRFWEKHRRTKRLRMRRWARQSKR